MPRIISGSARGIRLDAPSGDKTRPTTDRVKESVFNILAPYLADAVVIDLFAGSGQLGAEALSRGAKRAIFVDQDRACVQLIRNNLERARLSQQAEVWALSAAEGIARCAREGVKADLVVFDPPYCREFVSGTLLLLVDHDIIVPDGIVAVEHHRDEPAPAQCGGLERVREEQYGETVFSFYLKNQIEP